LFCRVCFPVSHIQAGRGQDAPAAISASEQVPGGMSWALLSQFKGCACSTVHMCMCGWGHEGKQAANLDGWGTKWPTGPVLPQLACIKITGRPRATADDACRPACMLQSMGTASCSARRRLVQSNSSSRNLWCIRSWQTPDVWAWIATRSDKKALIVDCSVPPKWAQYLLLC
jgi:hypothetical protein